MPINRELHKENLKALVAEYGGNKPLAAAINLGINAPDKPLEDNQISNALRDHRPFGEKIRRKIEAALGLPPQWFEHPHTAMGGAQPKGSKTLSESALWLAHVFDRLPPTHQESLLNMVEPHASTWAPDLIATKPRAGAQKNKESAHAEKSPSHARAGNRPTRRASKTVTGSD